MNGLLRVCFVGALVLCGCGSSDGDGSSGADPGGASPASQGGAAGAAGGTGGTSSVGGAQASGASSQAAGATAQGGAAAGGEGGSAQAGAAGEAQGGGEQGGNGQGGNGQGGNGQGGNGQGGNGQAGQGGGEPGGGEQGGNGQAGQGGGSAAGESVTLRGAPCAKSPGAATRCESYEVVCEGLPAAIVDIAFYEPDAGVPRKGTILFGSGGDGTGFYNFTEAKALLKAGYTIADRRWPDGWFTGANDGPQQAACRLASVARMLKKTVAADQPLCATGNSGGSAENVFALTWQNMGASLDFALPTSGPFHRLDLACQGDSDQAWVDQCKALVDSRCPDCASKACQLANGPRSLMDVSFGGTPRCTTPGAGDIELLKARSPDVGPSVASLGKLPVHFLIGKDDPGAYAPLATSLVDELKAMGVDATMGYVTGAPHEFDSTPAGAAAIRDELLAGCVPLP